jgi:hypothetical protein
LGLGSYFSFSQETPSIGHLFAEASIGQTFCITKDGRPCPPDVEMRYCAGEKVTPNLSVARPSRLSGILLDPTGAPITYKDTLVQVRNAQTGTVLFSAPLDEKGRFNLGSVPAGEFRLIAVMIKDGKFNRLPLADQPTALSCNNESACNLRIVIHFHGTDDPIDFCPPR